MNRRRVLIETSWNVKLINWIIANLLPVGINRNIVECKVNSQSTNCIAIYVLIETSWNVKQETLDIIGRRHTGINRNIVECKDYWVDRETGSSECINRNIVECKVLKVYTTYIRILRINRNIVECKVCKIIRRIHFWILY